MKNIFSRLMLALILSSFTALYSIETFTDTEVIARRVGVILTFIISFFLLGRYDLRRELDNYKNFTSTKKRLILVASFLCTLTLVRNTILMLTATQYTIGELFQNINLLLLLVLVFIIGFINFFILWYLFIKLCGRRVLMFFKSFSPFEKRILYLYVFVFAIINLIIVSKTNAFVYPLLDGKIVYDAILSLDTSFLTGGWDGIDVFSSPSSMENDIRHILFGIISLPLAMIAMPLSYAIGLLSVSGDFQFVTWNYTSVTLYGYLISVGQAFLFALSGILINKMLRREISEQLSKLFVMLYLVSYSTLLFTMAVEQYAVVTFTLILFVYCFVKNVDSKNTFILSSLTLASSFAMLPFAVLGKKINLKAIFKNLVYIATVTLVACIYFGQLAELARTFNTLKFLSQFADADSLSYTNKFLQFIEFIPNIFVAPEVYFIEGWVRTAIQGNGYKIAGIILLIFTLYSIIVNRHKRIVLISSYWVFISFILLVVIGWGSVQRSMFLYTPYFGWAFLLLIALGYAKLFGNRVLGKLLLTVIFISVAFYNAMEFASYVANLGPFR